MDLRHLLNIKYLSGIMLNRIKTERNIVLCQMWYRYGYSIDNLKGRSLMDLQSLKEKRYNERDLEREEDKDGREKSLGKEYKYA